MDERMQILQGIENDMKASTAEFIANQMLFDIADQGKKDLGTIRRALLDLIAQDLILVSHREDSKSHALEYVKKELSTSNEGFKNLPDNVRQSHKRLIDSPGKIEPIRLVLSFKGKDYLEERRHRAELTRREKRLYAASWVGLIFVIVTSISTAIQAFNSRSEITVFNVQESATNNPPVCANDDTITLDAKE
jgi:hypothetical protein